MFSNNSIIIVVLVIVLVISLAVGGYIIYRNGNLPFLNSENTEEATEETLDGSTDTPDNYGNEPSVITDSYIVGDVYYVQTELKVREKPYKGARWLDREELIGDDYINSQDADEAVLEEGSAVTCYEMSGNWMRIDSGWVCCYDEGEYLVR